MTRLSRPEPYRYNRAITVFPRVDGCWRRSGEYHRNITFEADEALEILRQNGIAASCELYLGTRVFPTD